MTIAQIEQLYYRTRGFTEQADIKVEVDHFGTLTAMIYHVRCVIRKDGSGSSYGRRNELLSNFTLESGRSESNATERS